MLTVSCKNIFAKNIPNTVVDENIKTVLIAPINLKLLIKKKVATPVPKRPITIILGSCDTLTSNGI